MSGLKIDLKGQEGLELEAIFEGQIDEDADFSALENTNSPVVVFNLEKVSMINSCGIREWIEFQKSLPESTKIVYRKCPQPIVEQLNIVKGFIRENGVVESFYAPYYNEETDEEIKALLRPEQVVDGKAPEVKDEQGRVLEFDEIEAQYFNFLKNA